VQWNATFAVPFAAGHFCSTKTTRALNSNSLCASLLRILHCTLHRTAERHAVGELIGNTLGNESGVEFRLLDFVDVQLNLVVAGES
jgi:hypothetical protein